VKNPVRVVSAWIDAPMPVMRLEIIRLLSPVFVLGFMSGRLIHADEWIGSAGFRVPPLPHNPGQPLYVPPLPSPVAWAWVTLMVIAGILVTVGYRTRVSLLVFATTLGFVSISDRLAAFTVSKISPIIMLALACGPAGHRWSVDAWLAEKAGRPESPLSAPLAPVRFLQAFLVTFYSASGIAKAGGDWIEKPYVLWSHLHDTYQTYFAYLVARFTPTFAWTPLQYAVLMFETFAPLWFSLRWTRLPALLFGLMMHTMIGLMFGPVVWFALLMMVLLYGCFAPPRWIEATERLADSAQRALRRR
jgi:hypothetical protein